MNSKIIEYSRTLKRSFHGSFRGWYRINTLRKDELKNYQINALKLLSIEKPIELSTLLHVSFTDLERVINSPEYISFRIPKKRNGFREILAPKSELKIILKRLNYFLQAWYLCVKPERVYGFVINPRSLGKRHDIAENARAHVGSRHLLNIDFQDFFPGISVRRIKQLFSSPVFEFSDHISLALALLVTFRGYLPTGAPTSPVISNFVCLEFDKELSVLSEEKGYSYTRYADDLTFSSDSPFSLNDLAEIEECVIRHGFRVNHSKTRITGSNRKQVVTGLVVNEKLNIDRRLLKKVRAMINDSLKNGLTRAAAKHLGIENNYDQKLNQWFLNKIIGYLGFIRLVRGMDDHVYQRLCQDFIKVNKSEPTTGHDRNLHI